MLVSLHEGLVMRVIFVGFSQVFYDSELGWPQDFSFESSDCGGKWKQEKECEGHEDCRLSVSEPAKKYCIAVKLPKEVHPWDWRCFNMIYGCRVNGNVVVPI